MKRVYTYAELWEINGEQDCVIIEYAQNVRRILSICRRGNKRYEKLAELNYKLPLRTWVMVIPHPKEGQALPTTNASPKPCACENMSQVARVNGEDMFHCSECGYSGPWRKKRTPSGVA